MGEELIITNFPLLKTTLSMGAIPAQLNLTPPNPRRYTMADVPLDSELTPTGSTDPATTPAAMGPEPAAGGTSPRRRRRTVGEARNHRVNRSRDRAGVGASVGRARRGSLGRAAGPPRSRKHFNKVY